MEAKFSEGSFALLEKWRKAKIAADKAKLVIEDERALRDQVFNLFIVQPKEGTNTVNLPAGWVLKGVYPLKRAVDEAELAGALAKLEKLGVRTADLIAYTPSLKKKAYVELTEKERKIMDKALTTSEGSLTLTLLPPKTKNTK